MEFNGNKIMYFAKNRFQICKKLQDIFSESEKCRYGIMKASEWRLVGGRPMLGIIPKWTKLVKIPDWAEALCWAYIPFGQRPMIDRKHMFINPILTKTHVGQKPSLIFSNRHWLGRSHLLVRVPFGKSTVLGISPIWTKTNDEQKSPVQSSMLQLPASCHTWLSKDPT